MSPLENMLQERQTLEHKGYTDDQIQSAALMLIAEHLALIGERLITLTMPIIKVNKPEDLEGTDKPSLSKADADN